ncbi:retropepsin-like aspartic protease [Acidipila rosea]|uniref:Aspartyl protease n=1 Tax=Acidipila rosea TaxID=768535 RepID=A0A4R1L4Y0_9BACT|nr:retropepsin-like aspartic protease [Acidipila rosea]TCK72043.1 aspartyl protease [Acidipila rosea]
MSTPKLITTVVLALGFISPYSATGLSTQKESLIRKAAPVSIEAAKRIPVSIARDLILVPVEVNGRQTQFILDSGFAGIALNRRLATEQNLLPAAEKMKLKGLTQTAKGMLSSVTGVQLVLGGEDISEPKVLVLDLSPMESASKIQIGGLLGASFLSRHLVSIHYQEQVIVVGGRVEPSGADIVLPFDRSRLPIIAMQLQTGPRKFSKGLFMVDTGSDSGIILNSSFASHHEAAILDRHLVPRGYALAGLTGSASYQEGFLRSVLVGAGQLSNQPVTIVEAQRGVAGDSHLAGTIGNAFLSRFTLVIDYEHARVILRPLPQSKAD